MSRPSLARRATLVLLGLFVSASGVLFAPSAAAAALATPSFSGGSGGPTAQFTVSGSGCVDEVPGRAGVMLKSSTTTHLGDYTTTQPDGSWSSTTNFIDGVALGDHTIVATCDTYNGAVDYPTLTVTVSATGVTLKAAAPAPAPCSTCTPVKSGDTIAVGDVVVLRLTGYKPHEVVTVVMRSTPVELGRFTADASGVVDIRFTVPRNGAVGSNHTLTFSGNMGTPDYVLPFTLGAAKPQLAVTGSDVAVPLTVGVGLLVVGGGLVLAARRRGSETAAQA